MNSLTILSLMLSAATAMNPTVICTSTSPAVLGGNVTLTCEFPYELQVVQVTWQKKTNTVPQTMVTSTKEYGLHIAEPFKDIVSVLRTDTTRSSIAISKLVKEDEACYNCIFVTFPDGAYTGEVCLTNLVPSNEVTCLGKGKHLNIIMTPTEIIPRQSAQGIKSNTEEPSVQKGIYIDGSIHPACTFHLQGTRRKNRSLQGNHKKSSEGWDDVIITQCSASGRQRTVITWDNEENVISREDKENTTGNITTVTSTIHLSVSSLSTNFSITCNITHEGDSQFTKNVLDKHKLSIVGIFFAAVLVTVILLVIAFYAFYKLQRRYTSSAEPKESLKLMDYSFVSPQEPPQSGSPLKNRNKERDTLLRAGDTQNRTKKRQVATSRNKRTK